MSGLPPATTLSRDAALDELALYMRPPGQGIHAVSTGRARLLRATQVYLGEGWEPESPWRDALAASLEGDELDPLMMAIPSDTGAGIVRGAARGPEAIRAKLGRAPVSDLGDVFCIPHLLDDTMLSEAQREKCRRAIHPEIPKHLDASAVPVAPLSMAARACALVRVLAPSRPLFVLGGDHTVSWAPLQVLLDEDPAKNADFAIVHFDAHTDLLPHRLGVDYCFATWAWHANERLAGGERILQLGIRASGHDRAHWESNSGVRQVWAGEAIDMSPAELAELACAHLERIGAGRVYLTNDIDGTDAHFAAACGTPERDGLTPNHVRAVIEAVGAAFEVVGADLVEVAPGLSLDQEASARTVQTAAQYAQATLMALEAAQKDPE